MRTRTAFSVLALGAMTAGLLTVPTGAATADSTTPLTEIVRTTTFTAGQNGTFTVPAGVTSLTVKAVGGQGGSTTYGAGLTRLGGQAMGVQGALTVTPGQKIAVHVATNGSDAGIAAAGSLTAPGGLNGGAPGGTTLLGNFPGGGGGGASDLRLCSDATSTAVCDDLVNRVLVAGGGGGAGTDLLGLANGGNAGQAAPGLLSGLLGGGAAGTPTAGGLGGALASVLSGVTGLLGLGGAGGSTDHNGAGGGGAGLFGGGGGAANLLNAAGGGGGSSLIPSGMLSALVGRSTEPVVELTYKILAPFQLAFTQPSYSVDSLGRGQVTVTVRLTGAGNAPISGQTVSFSATGDALDISGVTDNGDGTYSVTIKTPSSMNDAAEPTLTASVSLLGASINVPVTLNIAQPPSISGTLSEAANSFGWHNKPVVITWACEQGTALLGQDACPEPTTVDEGPAQDIVKTVTDILGLVGTSTIQDVQVDKTAPTLKVKGAKSGWTYVPQKKARKLTCVAEDSLSGIDKCTVSVKRIKGTKAYTYKWKATAFDKAGNSAVNKGWYKVKRTNR